MIPIWLAILVWVTGVIAGGILTYLFLPRKAVGVDRTEQKEIRPLNVFDAYSDEEMEELRKEAAGTVRQYRTYNVSQMTLQNAVEKLRKIDDEIEARKNAKLALEESKRTQHEREIAMFDTVYGRILAEKEKR